MNMYDLQRWLMENNKAVHKETHVTNKPYAICKDAKINLEAKKQLPGTYFKITKNK